MHRTSEYFQTAGRSIKTGLISGALNKFQQVDINKSYRLVQPSVKLSSGTCQQDGQNPRWAPHTSIMPKLLTKNAGMCQQSRHIPRSSSGIHDVHSFYCRSRCGFALDMEHHASSVFDGRLDLRHRRSILVCVHLPHGASSPPPLS